MYVCIYNTRAKKCFFVSAMVHASRFHFWFISNKSTVKERRKPPNFNLSFVKVSRFSVSLHIAFALMVAWLSIKPFILLAESKGRPSLAILMLHQAAWRIISARLTKPYCLHFPHEGFQICSSSKSEAVPRK